jgi:hypothetical protein
MTQRKPDRAERMVNKLPTDCEAGTWKGDVVTLLRQEHAWMRRMVNQVARNYSKPFDEKIGAILTRLEQRRK